MRNFNLFFFIIYTTVMISVNSCKDTFEEKTYFTTDVSTIAGYLELYPETFSDYIEILHKTGYYSSLSSYGNYTCFVPNNQAVSRYLNEVWNVTSVQQLTTPEQIADLHLIVKFHILVGKRLTTSFTEGRLTTLTFSDDFLTTSFLDGGGIQNVMINRKARIITPDLNMDNGLIHVIDNVMEPTEYPVPFVLEKNGKYKIFVEALKRTGYFDIFSTIYNEAGIRVYYTIFAEPDLVFNVSNINSFNDLANLVSPGRTDFMEKDNPLNKVIAYHASPTLMYTSDLPISGLISMVLENSVMKIEKEGTKLKINETETDINDTWLEMNLLNSNIPARNGVYHELVDVINVEFSPPQKYLIYDPWDDCAEVKAGIASVSVIYESGFFSSKRFFPSPPGQRALYDTNQPTLNGTRYDWKNLNWLEVDTPVLPKGKYEFLICANGNNSARSISQIFWDGEPIGKIFDLTVTGTNPHGYPDDEILETNGWRRGLPWITDRNGNTQQNTRGYMRFIVSKDLLCPIQKSHTVRFEFIKSGTHLIDYFEFIPVID